jgi:hypothetical protein
MLVLELICLAEKTLDSRRGFFLLSCERIKAVMRSSSLSFPYREPVVGANR